MSLSSLAVPGLARDERRCGQVGHKNATRRAIRAIKVASRRYQRRVSSKIAREMLDECMTDPVFEVVMEVRVKSVKKIKSAHWTGRKLVLRK